MTEKLYLANPGLHKLEAIVTSVRTLEDGRVAARVDRTIFHPQGGGQRADRGQLGRAHVLHVMHDGPQVDHIIDQAAGITAGDTVMLEIDPGWRMLNTVFHTAGHLLAGLVEARYPGLRAVSGHQWPGEARVEFDGDGGSASVDAATLNRALAEAIAEDWQVDILAGPEGTRQMQIGNLPPIPCGGTHVRRLHEVGSVDVTTIKTKGGRVRMSYAASVAACALLPSD